MCIPTRFEHFLGYFDLALLSTSNEVVLDCSNCDDCFLFNTRTMSLKVLRDWVTMIEKVSQTIMNNISSTFYLSY